MGYLHVVGMVANVGSEDAQFVQIVGTFYDSAGNVVQTQNTFTDRSIVPAGDVSPFEVLVQDQGQQITKMKLTVEGEAATDSPVTGLQAMHMTTSTDDVGYVHVKGEVQNSGKATATFVKVIVAYYDSAGDITAVATTFTNPSTLNPGDSAPFDAIEDGKYAGPSPSTRVWTEAQSQ